MQQNSDLATLDVSGNKKSVALTTKFRKGKAGIRDVINVSFVESAFALEIPLQC